MAELVSPADVEAIVAGEVAFDKLLGFCEGVGVVEDLFDMGGIPFGEGILSFVAGVPGVTPELDERLVRRCCFLLDGFFIDRVSK